MSAGDAERIARVGWDVVAEPGDPVAVALVDALGAARSLTWARWAVGADLDTALRALLAELRDPADAGAPHPWAVRRGVVPDGDGSDRAGSDGDVPRGVRPRGAGPGTDRRESRPRDVDRGLPPGPAPREPGVRAQARSSPAVPFDPTPPPTSDGRGGAAPPADPEARRDQGTSPLTGPTARRVLGRALARWAPRLADLDPGRVLDRADRLDARVVVPGDAEWPTGLDDLGGSAPLCLWVRGPVDLAAAVRRSVALVGARAATAYGEHVAADLAAGLAEAGCTVVSGGAYGIDVAAHRGALAVGGPTIALLAGGVDRTYPAGNHTLLESLAREHGAVVAECPPGTAPVRARFLLRNRLIAALSGATVVVEAAWRSGALSTATHAAALLRPLGAVPGPVTSMASAGCHRLIRDGAAVCVTGTPDVLELVGPRPPTDGARQGAGPTRSLGGGAVAPGPADESTRGAVGAALGRVVDGPVVSGPVESGSVRPRPMSSGPVVPGPAVSGPVPSGPVVQGSMTSGPVRSGPAVSGSVPSAPVPEIPRPDDAEARILDALPLRGTADVDTLARTAGLARQEVEAALGRLELAGRVRRREGRWSMVRPRA